MFEQPKISSLPTVLFTQCPLLPVLISLVAGIVLARYIQGSDLWWVTVALIFLSAASKLLKWPVLFMLLLGVPVGMLCEKADGHLHSSDVVYNPSQRVSCRGVVLRASDGTVNTRLLVDLDSPYSGICYLTVTGSAGFYAGDIVKFEACILPLSSRHDVDGDIDLDDFYYRYHVACRAVAVHGTLERVGEASGLRWSATRQREHLIDRILDTQLSPSTQEFAVALLLGDDTLLDDSARRNFSRAGLAHLLALSGMHVAIFSLVISLIFYPIAFLGYRRVRWLLVIAVLWCYALLTGLSPSVVRAATMFSIVLLGKCVGRRSTSGNALCLAAIVLLIFSPRELYAPGLQLSFIAVASLIAIPSLLPEVSITHRLLKWGYDYMVFTLAATTGTLMLAAYYFHTVPLFFLVTNIPIAFLLPVFMVGVLVVMVLSATGVSLPFLDRGVDFVSDLIGKLAQTFGRLPVSAIDDVYIPAWGLLAGYLGITLILLSVYYRPKLRLAVAGLVSLLLLAMSGLISRPDEEKYYLYRPRGRVSPYYCTGIKSGSADRRSENALFYLLGHSRYR